MSPTRNSFILKHPKASKNILLEYKSKKIIDDFEIVIAKKKHLYQFNSWNLQSCEEGQFAFYILHDGCCAMCGEADNTLEYKDRMKDLELITKDIVNKYWKLVAEQ